ncbi:uncharacterized protein LOC114843704 [Betta splendens]|uniref:Uncharacterized protein LOC114843704 n=1 Tax=Betta splendens TaxID=158456 RepID=A0A6P7KV89_BETSP|nr:uncharacterized protein LOC114843704 [Betta splendens]XP_055365254.1 uncharacterized protein LOC114843704 [Betta splendens]XP_055365255.1 uncharacterized protein LOC114843704 [Betta splendens]XP_055365256.1 uncharacterized protein LOC114843704 [Betta splendens]XP_055365257.1 uncharacterized protein LOC114843704 [Betta splendens]
MSSRRQSDMVQVTCVAIKEWTKILRFRFTPAPEASCTQHQRDAIFWDGERLLRTTELGPQGNLTKIKEGETYFLKGCRVTESGFLNLMRDSKIYLSSKMDVPQAAVEEGRAKLFPMSPHISFEDLQNPPTIFSVCGKVVKMSQILCKGDNLPLKEITITNPKGEEAQLSMWRECALQKLEINKQYNFTHLKMKHFSSYGRKCCSTSYTQITAAKTEDEVDITVKGVGEDDESVFLLTELGTEVIVPKGLWKGEMSHLSKLLPLSVHVIMEEGKVVKVDGLPTSEE